MPPWTSAVDDEVDPGLEGELAAAEGQDGADHHEQHEQDAEGPQEGADRGLEGASRSCWGVYEA